MVYKYLHGEEISDRRWLLNLVGKGVTKSSSWKLKRDKFRVGIRCKFLTVWLVGN